MNVLWGVAAEAECLAHTPLSPSPFRRRSHIVSRYCVSLKGLRNFDVKILNRPQMTHRVACWRQHLLHICPSKKDIGTRSTSAEHSIDRHRQESAGFSLWMVSMWSFLWDFHSRRQNSNEQKRKKKTGIDTLVYDKMVYLEKTSVHTRLHKEE